MQQTTLQQKLDSLAELAPLDTALVNQFGEILTTLDDWTLLRVNPLTFAETYQINPKQAVDLFVYAVKVGIFDFQWNMICPMCGGVEYSSDTINEVQARGFLCTVCQAINSGDLDDRVEVTFKVNPTIRKLEIDPFASSENYNRYFFSKSVQFTPKQEQYFLGVMQAVRALQADEAVDLRMTLTPNSHYRFMSLILHQAVTVQAGAGEAAEPHTVYLDILPTGFSPRELDIPAGEVIFHIKNLRPRLTDVTFSKVDSNETAEIIAERTPQMTPMLTAKRLLNNQNFRDLFRVQTLRPDLTLNIRSLTLLFTDLKGSTELYDAAGDAYAYDLIQRHFKILTQATQRNAGAIVKTMGDAIMATFSTPHEGVTAAIEMMDGMASLNGALQADGHELGLKIGLHQGNTLAVNADDRLDYFGQTVNIAARVQGLAKSGEIWVSEAIYKADDIATLLQTAGYQPEKQSVHLKGVSEPTTVFRLYC